MSTELPDQADKQANRPPVDWAPPPWANRPTDEPPSDPGSIPGWAPPPWTAGPDAPAAWAPPPWSPDAADTRPFWRQIPGRLVGGRRGAPAGGGSCRLAL